MSTRPATKLSPTFIARTALAVLTGSLVLGTSFGVLAQDQPWPKAPPRRPPAAQPKPPAQPQPAPRKETPPAKRAPAEAAPAPPADEAAPPPDEAAPPGPGPDATPPPDGPSEPPAAAPAAPPEAPPAGAPKPTQPAADPVAPADEGAEPAVEPAEEEPAVADEAPEGCPIAVAPARPRPPAHPPGPPVPPLAAGPDELEWVEGAAVPPGYEPDTRVRKGLLIGGLVTFGVAWLGSAAAASYFIEQEQYDDRTFQVGDDSGEEYPAAAPLYVPIIGPFVAIGTMDPDKRITAALVADGVVQIGGVALALAGLIAQEQVLVRSKTASVAIVPTAAPDGSGAISLAGSF